MTSAKFLGFLTPSPLSAFGTDLYYKIYVTSLNTSTFHDLPPPSDVDIISGSPLLLTQTAPKLARDISSLMSLVCLGVMGRCRLGVYRP